MTLRSVIEQISPILRGWVQYFAAARQGSPRRLGARTADPTC
ncbi:MAG: hypothetical protein H0X25_02210 [Acidobacteriales bacterium]|nr:hypothetical protein [Terriglobales bacterium]